MSRQTEPTRPAKTFVCPWWMAYMFDNPLRRWMHPADRVLADYVRPGMTALDLGCGFGHFSLGLARLVGPTGRVVAVDVQTKMLDKTLSRARKSGLADRLEPRLVDQAGLAKSGLGRAEADFALASNMVHEVPDAAGFFNELAGIIKPGGRLYVMEPLGHVSPAKFEAEVALAEAAGFVEEARPSLVRERCVVLGRPEAAA